MALKNFSQFTPQTVLSATDFVVGYRSTDEIRTDLDSLTVAISGILISKGFTPGGSLGTVKRNNYRYTINAFSPLNAVSGIDDFGLNLTYTQGQLDVYRNGVHLVEGLDFSANNGTQILNLSTMNFGDVVDVVTLSAAGVTLALSAQGSVFTNHYRYTVPVGSVNAGSVNVLGADDLGNVLTYSSPNLDVYLNGSHLVYGLDYTALNGSAITLAEGLSSGDVVDVSVISAYSIGGITNLSAGVFKLRAGPGIILNPSYGVGDVTITGNTPALTGGNIMLRVGSTQQFKDLQSAINSLSAYSLDTTANVTISADPETINEDAWKVLRLYHPNGDRISLIGGISQIKSINNPIVSVVTASAGSLSATFTVDPTTLTLGRTVQKGDLIGIYSVSARDAYHSVNSYNGTDSGGHVLVGGSTSGTLDIPALGGFPVTNCWCILGAASADGMMQTYLSVVTAGVTMNPTGSQPVMGLSGNILKNWPNTLPLTVDLGSPTSIRFSGGQPVRILSAFPVGNVGQHIVFNGGGATNTWMNEGDLIITCGQTCVVKQVSSTAAVDVYTGMKFTTGGVLSGYTDRFGPIPHPGLHFFVRTFGERYRGVFRVEDVTGNNVTISVPDATYYSWTYNSVLYKFPVIPLPRYGIEKIGEVEVLNNSSGNQINAPITIHTTKIRTIGTTIPSNNIKNISRMAFDFTYENSLSGGNNGLNLGYDPEGVVASATSSVVLGSYVSFYNFLYGIWATNASTLTQSGNGSLAIGCNREVSLVRTGVTSLKRSLVNISGFNICGPTLGLYAYNEGSIIGSYGAIHGGFQWFVATDGSSLTFSYVNFCETGTTYEYFSPSYLSNYANATIGYSRFYVRQHLYYGIGVTYTSTLKLTYCNMDGNKKEISTLPALQFLTWPDYSGIINSFGCSFTGADIGWNMRFAATGSSERDLFINTSTALNLNVNSQLTAGIGGYYNLYMFNNVFAYVNAKSSLVINDSPRNAFQLGYVAGSGDPKGVYISASLYPYQLRNVAYTNLATGFTSATFTFLSLA